MVGEYDESSSHSRDGITNSNQGPTRPSDKLLVISTLADWWGRTDPECSQIGSLDELHFVTFCLERLLSKFSFWGL